MTEIGQEVQFVCSSTNYSFLPILPIFCFDLSHRFEYGCHITPPPDNPLWPVMIFVVVPLGISIAAITCSMLFVYCHVRKQSAASRKWSFGIGRANSLEKDVFWQCVSYVLAFYITWPIMFAVYLASVDIEGPLGLTILVAFVAPLQGFNNFLVFITPKVKRWYRRQPARRPDRNDSDGRYFAQLLRSFMPSTASSAYHSRRSRSRDSSDNCPEQDKNVTSRVTGDNNALKTFRKKMNEDYQQRVDEGPNTGEPSNAEAPNHYVIPQKVGEQASSIGSFAEESMKEVKANLSVGASSEDEEIAVGEPVPPPTTSQEDSDDKNLLTREESLERIPSIGKIPPSEEADRSYSNSNSNSFMGNMSSKVFAIFFDTGEKVVEEERI